MKFLVAHDGSAQADKALLTASEMAEQLGAEMAIVTVAPDLCLTEITDSECQLITDSLNAEAEASMKKVSENLTKKGMKAKYLVKDGHPAERILEAASEIGADLIIVGSHGRHGAERFFLGSVSAKVVDQAPCNVLVIK